MNRALFNRNADACESAKHPQCRCACGGQFHGTKHSQAWRTMTWEQIEKAIAEQSPTPDLFEAPP